MVNRDGADGELFVALAAIDETSAAARCASCGGPLDLAGYNRVVISVTSLAVRPPARTSARPY